MIFDYPGIILALTRRRRLRANDEKPGAYGCDRWIWADQFGGEPWSEEVFKELRQA
jgi:hypothetical protein